MKGGTLMILSIQEARDTLRIDGEDNDNIIIPLVESIPAYLETATGNAWLNEQGNASDPLAKTAARFLLILWYNAEQAEAERLRKTIDTLLTSLTVKAQALVHG